MRFKYSPDVDILMVYVSDEPFRFGEDNEGVIVHHGEDGAPLALEILDASQFVMFANTSLVTGQETINPDVPEVPFTKERNVILRAIPKSNADLRFRYLGDSDTLTIKFGDAPSNFQRRCCDMTVYYDQDELPVGLEIEKGRQFVLGTLESVLLEKEVSVG